MNPKATPAALRAQVSGSSFYAGMRVLPKAEREAMYSVYAFCRAVDDIADDEEGDRASRAAALDLWRADVDSLYAGRDPGQAELVAEAVRGFALEKADFHAVIDGMAMDVAQDIRWPHAATLDLYCDRVASAVGRLSVRIFGMADDPRPRAGAPSRPRAATYQHPARHRRGCRDRPRLPPAGGDRRRRHRDHRAAGGGGRPAHRRRGAPGRGAGPEPLRAGAGDPRPPSPGHLIAPRLMAAAYGKVLARMEAAGWAPPRERVRVSKLALLWTVARLSLAR